MSRCIQLISEDRLKELYTLKISALLHDIGKPLSWANQLNVREHVCFTERLVAPLGERMSRISSHHHIGEPYGKKLPKDYRARMDEKEEWITHVADFVASGADRRGEEEAARKDEKGVALPIEMSHVLSYGQKSINKMDASGLHESMQPITEKLKDIGRRAESRPLDVYLEIYEFLEKYTPIHFIPADTRKPINDVSLWQHLKLATAIATSVWWDGVLFQDPEKYKFALLIGDTDKIQDFINTSKRPPDLSARSEIIEKATISAASAIETVLGGPECIIFAAAGGLLAIAPPNKVNIIISQAQERFRMETDDELKMIMHYKESDGLELMDRIDEAWKGLFLSMRTRKLEDPTFLEANVKEDDLACDVCGFRLGIHETTEYDPLPYDANPRYELRCEVDYKRLSSQKGRGIKLEDIADENKLVALIKADGDDVASIFDGRKLKSLGKGKRMTPSRFSTISSLVDETCKTTLTQIVKECGKRSVKEREGGWMYAGGDDLLAVLPGIDAFECANKLEAAFREAMNDQVTLSAGIVVFNKKFPIYVALEAVSQLLANAKAHNDKASVDFEIISAIETTSQDLNMERRKKSKEAHLSGRPYKWDKFRGLQKLAGYLPEVMQPTQVNFIARVAFQDGCESAKDYVRYQMGRGLVPWNLGEEFIGKLDEGRAGYLDEGFFLDAFRIYNAFLRKKRELED